VEAPADRPLRTGRLPVLLVVGPLLFYAATLVAGADPRLAFPGVIVAALVAALHRVLFAWRSLIVGLILVILFLPMGRYTLPGSLPFQLEPYRLFVAFILVGWITSLLIDRRIEVRSTGFGGPLMLIFFAALASDAVNTRRIADLGVQADVLKRLTIFASFFVVLLLIASVGRTAADIDVFVRCLVGGGGVLAFMGLVEAATGFNAFNHLHSVVSFLRQIPLPLSLDVARGGRLRIYASAEHPIALSAVFVMLLPLALYLVQTTREKRWWAACTLLFAAAFATESRTGIMMLAAVILVFLWLRGPETRRLWPALLPVLLLLHFAVPGSIGSVATAFFPQGGIVAEEQAGAGTHGSGRLADLGPALHEWAATPLLGQGFGTRVTDNPTNPAPILDDEWLGTLLSVGAVGVFAWLWLFARFVRRVGREAKRDRTPRGQLLTALVASVSAFPVGMFTYDAFSFTQVTFLLFTMLALGAVTLAARPGEARAPVRAARFEPGEAAGRS
jgi:polysaccharide biosynthesis protein PslJ